MQRSRRVLYMSMYMYMCAHSKCYCILSTLFLFCTSVEHISSDVSRRGGGMEGAQRCHIVCRCLSVDAAHARRCSGAPRRPISALILEQYGNYVALSVSIGALDSTGLILAMVC